MLSYPRPHTLGLIPSVSCPQPRTLSHPSRPSQPHRLRDLSSALNSKPLRELLGYYEARPELASYTVQQEMRRMSYWVKTADGQVGAAAGTSS